MEAAEFREQYEQARALFQRQQYPEALKSLQVLLWAHPEHRDLLLSKALCLEALDRFAEAREVCGDILAKGEHAEAGKVLARLEKYGADTPQQKAPVVDTAKLLAQIQMESDDESPLAFLSSRRAYMVVFMLMFLLLAVVGPMLWWTMQGLEGQ